MLPLQFNTPKKQIIRETPRMETIHIKSKVATSRINYNRPPTCKKKLIFKKK